MKAIALLFTLLVLSVSTQAGDANFAGVWKLDKSKSDGLRPLAKASQTWTITQNDKTLSLDMKIADVKPTKYPYNLDGSETSFEVDNARKGKVTLKALWQESKKLLEVHYDFNGTVRGEPFVTKTTERWELADDGKTLKVVRTFDYGEKKGEAKLEFQKQ